MKKPYRGGNSPVKIRGTSKNSFLSILATKAIFRGALRIHHKLSTDRSN
jgi:hypothetical protein